MSMEDRVSRVRAHADTLEDPILRFDIACVLGERKRVRALLQSMWRIIAAGGPALEDVGTRDYHDLVRAGVESGVDPEEVVSTLSALFPAVGEARLRRYLPSVLRVQEYHQ